MQPGVAGLVHVSYRSPAEGVVRQASDEARLLGVDTLGPETGSSFVTPLLQKACAAAVNQILFHKVQIT